MFRIQCDKGQFGETDNRETAGQMWKDWLQFFHNMAQNSRGTKDYDFYVHCFNTLEIKEIEAR